jgi:hypothetical protein
MHTHSQTHTHTHRHTYPPTHTHTHTHTHTYTYTHTHTHTHDGSYYSKLHHLAQTTETQCFVTRCWKCTSHSATRGKAEHSYRRFAMTVCQLLPLQDLIARSFRHPKKTWHHSTRLSLCTAKDRSFVMTIFLYLTHDIIYMESTVYR